MSQKRTKCRHKMIKRRGLDRPILFDLGHSEICRGNHSSAINKGMLERLDICEGDGTTGTWEESFIYWSEVFGVVAWRVCVARL